MKKKLILFTALVALVCGCNKDENDNPFVSEGNLLVGTNVSNADGMSGVSYLQAINDGFPISIDNREALPIPFMTVPQVIEDDIYILPSSYEASDNKVVKYKYANGNINVSSGLSMQLPPVSQANSIVVVSPTKGYLSMAGLGKIMVFNPQTMTEIDQIDLTKYAIGDQNPDLGVMILRENLLFVALSQMVGGYNAAPDRAKSDVVIINTETDTPIKMITESTKGFSMPSRSVDKYSMFMDENDDIYISCLGTWGQLPGHKAGLLRIKKGETEFDSSYGFAITGATVEGYTGLSSYIASIRYVGNGIAYGYVVIPALYEAGDNTGMTSFPNVAVKIDIYKQEVKPIAGLDPSNGYGLVVSTYKDDEILIANSSKKKVGIYTFDISTGKVSVEPAISTVGNTYCLEYLRE